MKQSQLGLLLFVPLLTCLNGCKKSSPPEPIPAAVFSGNGLKYVQLTAGKYFIYKDSASALIDSVIVTTSNLESVFVPKAETNLLVVPAHESQRLQLVLTTFKNSVKTEWLGAEAIANFNQFAAADSSVVDLREANNNTVFFEGGGQSTVTVEGKTYVNVIITANDFGIDINNPIYKKTIYSWAKGVGIIRRTVITTGGVVSTYNLIRNN